MRLNDFLIAGALLAATTGGCAHKAADSKDAPTVAPLNVKPMMLMVNPTITRLKVTVRGIELNEKVQFEVGKAALLPASEPLLGDVVTVLKENPKLEKLEIQGHTSAEGGPELNMKLSQERADAVKSWLVAHGIDEVRLVSKGYGMDHPIADDKTEEGREQNRRVDFVVKRLVSDAVVTPVTQ